MASKRRNPLEVSKASASSSDEEDSAQSDIEEKEVKQQNNVVEEEDEDESGEEVGSGSETESGDESDADSDKTPPSPNVSDFTVRPIASKPMKDSDTPTKPESKPNKKKRISETEPSNQESSKTKKNKPSLNLNEDDDGVEESAKKGSSIPRLWSSEDEIVILKGMIEYQSSKGTIMYSDMEAFHEFIKKSLHVEVSKNQLMDKIRRLKKKYLTLVGNCKDGEDPAFSKPHEGKIFELSKKVWSFPIDSKKKKVKNVVVNGNVKIKSDTDSVGNSVLALPIQEGAVKQERAVGVSNWGVKSEKKEEVGSFESNYPCLNTIAESGKFFELTVPMFVKCGMKEMISSTESSKLKELEKKWKKLMMDEAELYLKRLDLIEEQTKLILDAMRASASKS